MITQEKKILPPEVVAYIEECKQQKHSKSLLIAVLQKVQEHFGYLPRECMDEVSERMQIPSTKVSGVATFYHFFSFTPKGRCRVTVCMGTACFVRGAEAVMERLKALIQPDANGLSADGNFSIEAARCLGACALAPVMVVNDKVYGNVKPDDVVKILSEYGFKVKS